MERHLNAEPFDPKTSVMIFGWKAKGDEETRHVIEGVFSNTLGVNINVVNAEQTTPQDNKSAAFKVELETVWDRVSVL